MRNKARFLVVEGIVDLYDCIFFHPCADAFVLRMLQELAKRKEPVQGKRVRHVT